MSGLWVPPPFPDPHLQSIPAGSSMSKQEPDYLAQEGGISPLRASESPAANPTEPGQLSLPAMSSPAMMNHVRSLSGVDSTPTATVQGIIPSRELPTWCDELPWCGELPAYTPDPLPDDWVVPPDIYHALSHARSCPDFFAIHAPDADQRLLLLIFLARWCSQERWWIFVPDISRAWELIQAWPDPKACLLLSNHAEKPVGENLAKALTLRELHDQIACQVRSRLHQRLQLLQQLQTITLELIRCDTIQAELASSLEGLEKSIRAEIEDGTSPLGQRWKDRSAPLQQRILGCEARRSQLREKLRLIQSQPARTTTEDNASSSSGWFSRIKRWLDRFHARGSDPTSNSSHPEQTTSQIQSLHEELQATEKELADLHNTHRAEYQRLLEEEWTQRRQLFQERLAQERAEHERLNAERERLIQQLSLTRVDGPTLEQEVVLVQRQLREIEPLIDSQVHQQLQQMRLVIGVAGEWEDLQRWRTLVGPVERMVYDSCEQIPEGMIQQALFWPSRHLLLGNILPTGTGYGELPDAVPQSRYVASASRWPARLAMRLDQRPWVVEGDYLVVRLRACPPDRRAFLRSEPLADHPEVTLRFWDISERETELVEILFPQSWCFAARALLAQQLEYYRPVPCGPAHWHESISGDIRVCWPAVERLACQGPSETIDWGNGIQEWCIFDGQTFYTAALTFRADSGWNRSTSEAWLQELLPPTTQQRLAIVTSRLPAPHLTAPSYASSSSSAIPIPEAATLPAS